MIMSPAGLGPDNDCWQGPAAIVNDRFILSSEKVSHIKNWQISDNNKNLGLGSRWVLVTKIDWPTDCRSQHDFYSGQSRVAVMRREEPVVEAGKISRAQREREREREKNVLRWKPLPSNG
jgi:hypothetical protein